MRDLVQALLLQGLITEDAALATAVGQESGAALPQDELMALADIDNEDIALAAETWNQSSSAPGLLDARTTSRRVSVS